MKKQQLPAAIIQFEMQGIGRILETIVTDHFRETEIEDKGNGDNEITVPQNYHVDTIIFKVYEIFSIHFLSF